MSVAYQHREYSSSRIFVMSQGVSKVVYYTGQFLDLERITRAAHDQGAVAGFDRLLAAEHPRLNEARVDLAAALLDLGETTAARELLVLATTPWATLLLAFVAGAQIVQAHHGWRWTKDGKFEIGGLPAGTYTIEAWHEKLKTKTASVTISGDETQTVDFTFSPPSR